jgi:hypothetical protein
MIAMSPNYTRFDLLIAIVLACLTGTWLLAFAAILITGEQFSKVMTAHQRLRSSPTSNGP